MLSEKKKRKHKMWSKKWYLKRNISCDGHLLHELLETEDAIVVSAGKLRKLWDSLSEVCKKTARKTEMNVVWHSTCFPSGLSVFCQFCVSSCACDYGG
jgi:hypothetical protein